MPLSYILCVGVFLFCFWKMAVLAWKSMLMYLFIYLFGSLPVPSFHWLLPRVLLSCCFSFLSCFFFFPLDLGTFWGGLQCLLGWRDSGGTAAVVPSVGGPLACLLEWVWALSGKGHCWLYIERQFRPAWCASRILFEQRVACWFYLSEILYRGKKILFFFYTWHFLNKNLLS